MAQPLIVGRGDRQEQITSAVYFKNGTRFHPVLGEDAQPVEVDEWHYQLLSASGTVMGHGDGYLDEEHVRNALGGLLDEYEIPWAEGEQQEIDPRDAEMGKRSATDTPSEVLS